MYAFLQEALFWSGPEHEKGERMRAESNFVCGPPAETNGCSLGSGEQCENKQLSQPTLTQKKKSLVGFEEKLAWLVLTKYRIKRSCLERKCSLFSIMTSHSKNSCLLLWPPFSSEFNTFKRTALYRKMARHDSVIEGKDVPFNKIVEI